MNPPTTQPLTDDELAHLRELMGKQLFDRNFWKRAWAVAGYIMAVNLLIYAFVVGLVIFFAGVVALAK